MGFWDTIEAAVEGYDRGIQFRDTVEEGSRKGRGGDKNLGIVYDNSG